MSNTNLFDRLVAETAILSSTPIPVFSTGHLKRWADLADFWKANPVNFPDLFFETIFHIARDRYSKADPITKPLLHLIEEALLTDLDALRSWRDRREFKCAFGCVIHGINDAPYSKQRWKSAAMRCFVEDRLHMLLMYRGKPAPQLDLKLIRNRRAYWEVCKYVEFFSSFTRFNELIELLVPACRNWSPRQWVNEKFIFAQIQALHGIDFSQRTADFDALVSLFKNKAERLPYYKNLFSIRNLSPSIANAIWGANLTRDICNQFTIACTVKPKLHHGKFRKYDSIYPPNLTNSWAFKQMDIWRKSTPALLTAETRSRMLHIALGEHPWNIKHGLPTAI